MSHLIKGDILIKDEGDFFVISSLTKRGREYMQEYGYRQGEHIDELTAQDIKLQQSGNDIVVQEFSEGGELQGKKLSEIASIIRADWKNVYFGARPYLDAMFTLNSIDDNYGMDDARSIVNYFLANASSWRGETAKQVKAYLKNISKYGTGGTIKLSDIYKNSDIFEFDLFGFLNKKVTLNDFKI